MVKDFKYKNYPLGSIERVFLISLECRGVKQKAADLVVEKRLNKMSYNEMYKCVDLLNNIADKNGL